MKPGRTALLQTSKMATLDRPLLERRYSGENDDVIDCECYMEKMEQTLGTIPNITDGIKLRELDYWFSGRAEEIARDMGTEVYGDAMEIGEVGGSQGCIVDSIW
jgi:hypothetical protein